MKHPLKEILDSETAGALTPERLWEMQSRWPAFTLPALAALESNRHLEKTEAASLAARVAAALPDADSINGILGDNADIYANFYPQPQPETPSTTQTIDTFLATFGSGVADRRETDALTKAIFNPVPDYAAVLAAEEQRSMPGADELDEEKVGARDAAINRYIANSKGRVQLPDAEPETESESHGKASVPEAGEAAQTVAEASEETVTAVSEPIAEKVRNAPESGALSESLARIMIKNRNYHKALEIISDLSLKNPEKSIYFADQIRFLRKLIVIENKKQ